MILNASSSEIRTTFDLVKKTQILALLSVTVCFLSADAQTDKPHLRKHSFYATWGYNRAHYQDSDIHIKGDGLDFTLFDVSAHDAPTRYESKTYLNPLRFTIPQFDFRVGFFLNENTSISGGWDHMKYVVTQRQRVRIDGTVSKAFSPEFAGEYEYNSFDIQPSFLRLEHTNGFNFLRFAIERHGAFWSNKKQSLHADVMLGLAAGPLITWTDAYVDNVRYKNWLHVAGWGASGQVSVKFRYKNTFFIQYQHQTGYTNLSDIIFMDESSNRASQQVVFNEQSISIGAQIPIFIGGNPNPQQD